LALGKNQEATVFAKLSHDNGLWAPLLEKAMAKFHGNYIHLDGGEPSHAVNILNGSPTTWLGHKNKWYNQNKNEYHQNYKYAKVFGAEHIFNTILSYDTERAVMTCGTGWSNKEALDNGIWYGHAYSVLGAVELSTGDKIIKVRDPLALSSEDSE